MPAQESPQSKKGIVLQTPDATALERARAGVLAWLDAMGLAAHVELQPAAPHACAFALEPGCAQRWAPESDTTGLCEALGLDTQGRSEDLEREIVLAMLLSPVAFVYPNCEELAAAVRIRRNIVVAARRTGLAFHTSKIERPTDCWTYQEGRGFTVLPGVALIDALHKATQPPDGGELYAFSCYRATEYVILLGLAQELRDCNPALLQALQRQWESRAIMSGQFHEVFLREYGSMEEPLPARYYVPGDRLWFRNPDEHSSDVTGYEGSWVFYLGGGLFTNFWDRDHPYTLTAKCVEVYHWRHGAYRDPQGELQMDEEVVARHVCATMENAQEKERIVTQMMRLREPKGVYRDGGCIDTTREYPRWVCPGTADMVLPGA
ncbi:MAG: hypothetical protein ACT4NV_10065 [Rhodoferax sp.]